MRIAQVSLAEVGGGAERVARTLHVGLSQRGHETALLTPTRHTPDPTVRKIDTDAGRPSWQRWIAAHDRRWARPLASWNRRRGLDDWNHPWTRGLLSLLPWRPDVLILHQLHGGWFDLRALPALSAAVPTVVVLHDGWWLHHGPDHRCDVGQGPWQPHILASNAAVRSEVFTRCRLHVVAPTRWMISDMAGSTFERAVVSRHIIAHGIDTRTFHAQGRAAARLSAKLSDRELGVLAVDAAMGTGYREPAAVIDAVKQCKAISERSDAPPELRDKRVVLLTVGRGVLHRLAQRKLGEGAVRWLGPGGEAGTMAACYRAADVLAYATRADSFSLTVCESLACGTPVVASAIGGVPEVIDDGHTGLLTPPGNSDAMARQLADLLGNPARRAAMSHAATQRAAQHFTLDRMLDDYEHWLPTLIRA